MHSILVVDSNPNLCSIISEYLALQAEFTICGMAFDGRKAVELVREYRPSVVILDIGLPLLDGFEVLDILRGDLPKVLMLTSFLNEHTILKALSKGADYCLLKPVYLSVLKETIKEICTHDTGPILFDKTRPFDRGEMSIFIENYLTDFGISKQLKGYQYLFEALYFVFTDSAVILGPLEKHLYPVLAKKYDTRPESVEAAIRGAIKSGFDKCRDLSLGQNLGTDGFKVKSRPTVSEFLHRARLNTCLFRD